MRELRLKLQQILTDSEITTLANNAINTKMNENLEYTDTDLRTHLGLDALQPMASELQILQQ